MFRAVLRFNETDLKEIRDNSVRRTIFVSEEEHVVSDPRETRYESNASVEQADTIERNSCTILDNSKSLTILSKCFARL